MARNGKVPHNFSRDLCCNGQWPAMVKFPTTSVGTCVAMDSGQWPAMVKFLTTSVGTCVAMASGPQW